MVMDLKLLTVILCVLLLCDQVFTRCKMNEKKCKRKGGQCYRQNEIPSGVPILEGCQGKCKCYKEVESIPTSQSAMENMTNMEDMTNKTNITNMTNIPNIDNMPNMMNMTNMDQMINITDDRKRSGYRCDVNDWDSYQYCKCRPGQRISKFESYHDNHREDRQWHLQCSDILPYEIARHTSWLTYGTGYLNSWDGYFIWPFTGNCYMVGMRSYHDNHREDRKYELYYSCSDQWTLTSCSEGEWLNSWDGQVKHVLGSRQVIAALLSVHNNHREDRRFMIIVCDLVPKCDQLVSITYDYGKMTVAEKEETIGQGTYDNRGSTSQNFITAYVGYSQQNRLADTYTFSRTSGWSTTASLEVTFGYNWGVKAAGAHFSVTAGFSKTYQTSNTWSRSQTKTYSETHSNEFSITAKCKAGCFCKLFFKMTNGKGHVPYTMITKSKGGSDRCEEKGVLTIGRAWNGNGKSEDEC